MAIEDIQAGDLVYAWQESTSTIVERFVTETYIDENRVVYEVVAGEQSLTVTEDHPFWIVEKQNWVEVASLAVGMTVELISGEPVQITSIELQPEQATVYNFSVEQLENYFAGERGVLVHNCGVNYKPLDSLGRPTGVSAKIDNTFIGKGTHANSRIQPPGFITGAGSNRARGHLLGRQLGGSGDDVRNLVTIQQRPANTPVMSGYEAQIRQALERGEVIRMNITPIYYGSNRIPRGISIDAVGSNNFSLNVTILNPPGM